MTRRRPVPTQAGSPAGPPGGRRRRAAARTGRGRRRAAAPTRCSGRAAAREATSRAGRSCPLQAAPRPASGRSRRRPGPGVPEDAAGRRGHGAASARPGRAPTRPSELSARDSPAPGSRRGRLEGPRAGVRAAKPRAEGLLRAAHAVTLVAHRPARHTRTARPRGRVGAHPAGVRARHPAPYQCSAG